VLAPALLPGPVQAEELSLLAGATERDDHISGSYAWGMEYRQSLFAHLGASFGYLNEGHLQGHHRDGGTLQLWADSGSWRERMSFALGAGPYVYFDTQPHSNYQGYSDQHGVGLMVSGRMTYSLSRRWFAALEADQVMLANPTTRTVMVGLGYLLEPVSAPDGWKSSGEPGGGTDPHNEMEFFVGQTILNNLGSNKSTDLGFEYRYRWGQHFELSGGVLDEGTGAVERHAGVYGEMWAVQDFLARRLAVGLGIGPYMALNTYRTSDGRNGASALGLAAMTVSWRLGRPLVLRLSWDRAFTTDDQDRDIITAGVGLRW